MPSGVNLTQIKFLFYEVFLEGWDEGISGGPIRPLDACGA
jgi:hypothetical protein